MGLAIGLGILLFGTEAAARWHWARTSGQPPAAKPVSTVADQVAPQANVYPTFEVKEGVLCLSEHLSALIDLDPSRESWLAVVPEGCGCSSLDRQLTTVRREYPGLTVLVGGRASRLAKWTARDAHMVELGEAVIAGPPLVMRVRQGRGGDGRVVVLNRRPFPEVLS